MMPEEIKTALIVVRTYPVPDALGIESSCTAAITDRGEWLRLFPVPWRLLSQQQRFRRYEWVRVAVRKSAEDTRRESYRLRPDGIEILSEPLTRDGDWKARRMVVEPMMAHCLCCLSRLRDSQQHPTLGIFKPASIDRLRIVPADPPDWTVAELTLLRQQNLFVEAPKKELEKIPFKFYYSFQCAEPSCPGHTMMCTDWEMSESYRKWRTKYGEGGWQEKFRLRYETEMINKLDTHFFVGTVAAHPNRWIIIGLFYPPRQSSSPQMGLSFLPELPGS